ncbi:hypothetical protein ACIBTP_40545 [Streptomyces avidinii]|uniref:hypothetical protein n=1 Tax=Streptomyces avidinii TaxID=1895 RepID=UPI0037B609D5
MPSQANPTKRDVSPKADREGAAVNDQTPDKGWLGFYLFSWPTSPYWLYRLTQGVHVTLGIVLVPVLLAKLWSVIPKLFEWPPIRSISHALERLSLLMLVGGAGFEFVTGILNVQLHYIFPGSFYTLHFYGAWVFIGAFVVHVAFRLPRALRAVRPRLGEPAAGSEEAFGLVAPSPAAPTISRRGALAMVGLGSVALLVVTAGQSIGGWWRNTALLAPHGRDPGSGPNGFQINKTAASVGIRPSDVCSSSVSVAPVKPLGPRAVRPRAGSTRMIFWDRAKRKNCPSTTSRRFRAFGGVARKASRSCTSVSAQSCFPRSPARNRARSRTMASAASMVASVRGSVPARRDRSRERIMKSEKDSTESRRGSGSATTRHCRRPAASRSAWSVAIARP